MPSFNATQQVGRLTADPEPKTTTTGKNIVNFTLAVDKNKGEETNFFDCVAWEKTAEYLSKYAKKGTLLLVSGRLDQQTWEKDGTKKSKIIIIADQTQILSSVSQPKAETDNLDISEIPF